MKVRASERDASLLAISQRAQPKFDEIKVRASLSSDYANFSLRSVQPKFDEIKDDSGELLSELLHS